jgi:hypothetical protein
MSARIIEFRPSKAGRQRPAVAAAPNTLAKPFAERHPFEFWTGASGERYVHSVFSLIGCPELPPANIVLVSRDADGRRQALHIMRVENEAGSLNLAELRHLGANLGAKEVHVHLLGGNEFRRRMIEQDLQAAAEGTMPSRAANS